jgi:glycosyltransferase involved in cell wall biosynthesis
MPENVLLLSTVTPVYRGEEYLGKLVAALTELKERLVREHSPIMLAESIFVDDGAVDRSYEVLLELQKQHSWIRVISLSRNFGQHPATIAGILHSSGDWVATLDEDLQHSPKYLIDMFQQVARFGADVVYANPSAPVHGSVLRDGASKSFKFVLAKMSGNPAVRRFNSYRLVRGVVARAAAAVSSYDTYFDVALGWFSNRIASIELPLVDERYRSGGGSSYSWMQLLRHARRMLVTSQVKLLRLGMVAGLASLLLSLAAIMYVTFRKMISPESIDVAGWPTLAIGILFFGGLTSFLVGICLEYMTVLVNNVQGRPTFLTIDRSRDGVLKDWLMGR